MYKENIIFDKEIEAVFSENEAFDVDINVKAYCDKAQEFIVRNNKSQISMILSGYDFPNTNAYTDVQYINAKFPEFGYQNGDGYSRTLLKMNTNNGNSEITEVTEVYISFRYIIRMEITMCCLKKAT